MNKSIRKSLLCFSALGLLTGCIGVGGSHHKTEHKTTALTGDKSRVAAALERAELKASGHEHVAHLASVYNHNPGDVNATVAYAKALREINENQRAIAVLTPFIMGETPSAAAQTEYAATQIQNGNYASAENYAALALRQNAQNYEAMHYLAIAQDLQGKHSMANEHFNIVLRNWNNGAATSVMNNLALNLAMLGHIDEAAAMISNAAAIAPERRDVENNLRVINGLKNAQYQNATPVEAVVNTPAPVPSQKPVLKSEHKSKDKKPESHLLIRQPLGTSPVSLLDQG